MFNTIKERRAAKIAAKQEAAEMKKREEEVQTKIRIRRTLNMMKNQSAKMDSFKKEYIEKARQAALIGSKQNYNLAKQGLKMCLSKQKFLDAMITNFEIAYQMNEMNKVINSFVSGMNTVSQDMKGITSALDITKAQAAYDNALANNEGQYEALDAFLKEAEESIESFSGNPNDVTDDEIDKLINCQATDSESDMDDEIDAKINSLKAKMNA